MANRINYTDKVALNARTEIAEINKHTAANDNEIKNVVNAHATNIETLEANQTSGVIRADTIVDEGDGRSFLPVTGDTSTAYIVDGETAPDEVKNGNYEWDGAAYTKTAYQTVAGSKTDSATNGSQDVFTSQGAFDLDADLQGQIDSNDVEIAQNISDIAQNTLDITQNESDIADNQTRSTDTENILLVGSDAYTHAERGVSDGFTTERLIQLDNEIEANLDANYYFKAGHSKGVGKIGIAVPDVSAADLSLSRNANATFVNKRRLIETALPNVPRFDWSSGEPALLTEPQAENLIEYSEDISQWGNNAGGGTEVVTSNYLISPDGTQNADRIQTSGTNAGKSILVSDSTNNEWSYSGYIKNLSLSSQYRIQGNSIILGNVDIDVSTLQVVSSGGWSSLTTLKQMPNGWVYFKIEGIPRTAAGDLRFFATIQTSQGNQDLSVWGLQVVAGDKATSYIPTDGATAVRLGDTGIETGDISQYIDSTQGSFEVECANLFDGTFAVLNSSETSNRITIGFTSGGVFFNSFANGVKDIDYFNTTATDTSIMNNYRVNWSGQNFEFFINDVSFFTGTSSINKEFNELQLGSGNDAFLFKGQIKSIKIS